MTECVNGAIYVHVSSWVQPSEDPKDGRGGGGRSEHLLPASLRPGSLGGCVPLPKAVAPVTVFPKPLPPLVPPGFWMLMVTNLQY